MTQAFDNILFSSTGLVDEDLGTLTIEENQIAFNGKKLEFNLSSIQFASIEQVKTERGLVIWIRILYQDQNERKVAYFRENSATGKIKEIFTALEHFPNPGPFKCQFWAPQRGVFSGLYSNFKKGTIELASPGRIRFYTHEYSSLYKEEFNLADIIGYQREPLSAWKQIKRKFLNILIYGLVAGIIMILITLFRSQGEIVISMLQFFGIGLGIGVGLSLLLALPSLIGTRDLEVYKLVFKNGETTQFFEKKQQVKEADVGLKRFGIGEIQSPSQ
jgi:hypothetical protein